MKNIFSITSAAAIAMLFAISSCSTQDEKVSKPAAAAPAAKAEAKAAPAKAKAEKASGDIGLIDTEKNYMILVTKQGKLVTLDFDQKTKVTQLTPTPAKMADVGLGNSATVTYTKQNNKNIASGVEYKAKK
ncbi:MAG: hypothetical protein WD688_04955 [Candidatus Binatia bacterium]